MIDQDVALVAIRDKGLDAQDAKLLADFSQRFMWTLGRLRLEGEVVKAGQGPSARWELAGRQS